MSDEIKKPNPEIVMLYAAQEQIASKEQNGGFEVWDAPGKLHSDPEEAEREIERNWFEARQYDDDYQATYRVIAIEAKVLSVHVPDAEQNDEEEEPAAEVDPDPDPEREQAIAEAIKVGQDVFAAAKEKGIDQMVAAGQATRAVVDKLQEILDVPVLSFRDFTAASSALAESLCDCPDCTARRKAEQEGAS